VFSNKTTCQERFHPKVNCTLSDSSFAIFYAIIPNIRSYRVKKRFLNSSYGPLTHNYPHSLG
jgi:hypothetical protein